MLHPAINLLLVFIFIIILLRKNVHIGLTMTGAAILLGLLFGVKPAGFLTAAQEAVFSWSFLQLGVALNMITFLEHIMRTKDYFKRTVTSLQALVPSPKVNMMILPAFLGLLPSPGGALFSAPLVGEVAKDHCLTPARKSQINYWYRHIWEYCIPLYPGIILSAQVLKVSAGKISLSLIWCSLLAIIIGYIVIMRRVKLEELENGALRPAAVFEGNAWIRLISGVWPILLIVLTVLVFKFDVGLTVLSVILLLLIIHHYRGPELKVLWKEASKPMLLVLIAGILFFKEMLTASGVVEWLPDFLGQAGVPSLLIVMVLPFFVGFAVGITITFVGAAFPLLAGIIGTGAGLKPGMLILAYTSGFMGVMLSPVHLCLVLTIDYFKAEFVKVWRRILYCELILLGLAVLCALFWK
jgi:integral membrane protein (TIGR00529 family)